MTSEHGIAMLTIISTTLIQLSQLFLTGYVARLCCTTLFTYFTHRLDVLGKDGYVWYPQNEYEPVSDGRVKKKIHATAEAIASKPTPEPVPTELRFIGRQVT